MLEQLEHARFVEQQADHAEIEALGLQRLRRLLARTREMQLIALQDRAQARIERDHVGNEDPQAGRFHRVHFFATRILPQPGQAIK
jgi:hypothetical protein